MTQKSFARIPSVDAVLNSASLRSRYRNLDPAFLTFCVRKVIAHVRLEMREKFREYEKYRREELTARIVESVIHQIDSLLAPSLHRVVNATGVILHTGLGRAPLAKPVQENVCRIMQHYSNVELDVTTGKRGERQDHVEELLCYLSGAEAAAVVNNNAGAVFIALNTLARGKEVIVSRGQLIEIGGAFRLPDVMARSGAIMHEIGTTNKTHLQDYESAIQPNTGAILVAHSSNYRIMGFTEEVPITQLVPLAHTHGIPLIYDLGGGVFLDLVKFDLPYEPVVSENVRLGVDVITFSGDKVLGGPQSGILVGNKPTISAIRNNPLMRTLRCDKLILSALEATLKLYLEPEKLLQELPVFRMLLESVTRQEERITTLLNHLKRKIPATVTLKVEDGSSQIGSGALPLVEIPSKVLRVESRTSSSAKVAAHFRRNGTPVIGYIQDDGFYLNFRTILDEELEIIAEKIVKLS